MPFKSCTERYLRPGQDTPSRSFAAGLGLFTFRPLQLKRFFPPGHMWLGKARPSLPGGPMPALVCCGKAVGYAVTRQETLAWLSAETQTPDFAMTPGISRL